MAEPFEGRSLDVVLQRAREFGWQRLPLPLAVHAVLGALRGANPSGGEPGALTLERVRVSFEGEVSLTPESIAFGLYDCGALLYRLVTDQAPAQGGSVPDPLLADVPQPVRDVIGAALKPEGFASADDMIQPLAGWLAAQPSGPCDRLWRELLGQVFDAERLATGHLFMSASADRAKLQALLPRRPEPPPPPEAAAPPVKTRRPRLAIFAFVAGLIGVGVITIAREMTAPRYPNRLPPPPGRQPPPRLSPPEVFAKAPQVVNQQGPETMPAVAYDAEAGPVSFRLTGAHQVVVSKSNCFDVDKKWELSAANSARVLSSMPRGNYGVSSGSRALANQRAYSSSERVPPLFALHETGSGPARLLLIDRLITGKGAGQLCAFNLSDRSLEQEISPPTLLLNSAPSRLKHALINVEPDDRFVVRSFPRHRSWVVRVNDVTAPWPVLFYRDDNEHPRAVILDQKEIELHSLASVWLTVPVLVRDDGYQRDVSIELAPGETLGETAEKLAKQAVTKLEIGDYAGAANTLDRCVNKFPDFPRCHLLLGQTYSKLRHRGDEARAQYREFLRLAPKDDPEVESVNALLR